ncbi:hypothetical protein T01_12661 [Trichinella spiralis]|uniref:Uncharacterized protein n=1 Tax=Trichinella spiralis TaxID=6334 RepID=A0A0V1BEB0_TRISP|nr:hypothetical protein T01_12661 [Trichinella spiralis]
MAREKCQFCQIGGVMNWQVELCLSFFARCKYTVYITSIPSSSRGWFCNDMVVSLHSHAMFSFVESFSPNQVNGFVICSIFKSIKYNTPDFMYNDTMETKPTVQQYQIDIDHRERDRESSVVELLECRSPNNSRSLLIPSHQKTAYLPYFLYVDESNRIEIH